MLKMTLLAYKISRTYPILKHSRFSCCIQNVGKQKVGSWTLFQKPSPVLLLQTSSSFHSIPGKWSSCGHGPSGKRVQSTTANRSDVPLVEKPTPPIDQNQRKEDLMPRMHTETMLEEMDDVLPLSPLEEISEDKARQIVAEPLLPPSSFTLRNYVDRSETLAKLVLLGVDLSKLEKRRNVATFLLKLDFEKDVQKILFFLKDVGLEDGQLGPFITSNPFILTEDTDNLQKRVAYLASKKFSKDAITRMVSRAPYLLNFSVDRLDNRLGFFQKELGISPAKTRDLITRFPRMLTRSLEPIKENLTVCKIEMGFRENEIQLMITHVPKILTGNKRRLTEIFDYVHNTMDIPHHSIAKFPQVFNTRLLRIKERHMFLTFLGRAEYDPAQPNYISLDKLVSIPNEVFCVEVAKASVQDFEKFLKTL